MGTEHTSTERGDTRWASAYTSLPARSLEAKRLRGEGPRYVKIGQKVIYRKVDLDDWLEANVVEPSSPRRTA